VAMIKGVEMNGLGMRVAIKAPVVPWAIESILVQLYSNDIQLFICKMYC